MTDATSPEEPWEQDLAGLLGRLPEVEPPAGFVDRALRRRPLHAGRNLLGLGLASLVAVGLLVGVDGFDRSPTVPPIDDLLARHMVGIDGPNGAEGDEPAGAVDSDGLAADVAEAGVVVDEIRQLLGPGRERVSVFVQSGRVRWSALSEEGRQRIDGADVWLSPDRQVAVVNWGNRSVTLVGLDDDGLALLLAERPDAQQDWGRRVVDVVETLVVPLGYPSGPTDS